MASGAGFDDAGLASIAGREWGLKHEGTNTRRAGLFPSAVYVLNIAWNISGILAQIMVPESLVESMQRPEEDEQGLVPSILMHEAGRRPAVPFDSISSNHRRFKSSKNRHGNVATDIKDGHNGASNQETSIPPKEGFDAVAPPGGKARVFERILHIEIPNQFLIARLESLDEA